MELSLCRRLSAAVMLVAGLANAGQANVQFSADAVQFGLSQTENTARIFVGDNRVRLEYRRNDKPVIEVYDLQQQRVLLLLPEQSSYMEQRVPGENMTNPLLPANGENPCAGNRNAKCNLLGSEVIHGREVKKWEMVISRDDKQLHSLHWLDVERGMPLRQIWHDGAVSEMLPAGQHVLNGRKTERWKTTVTRPGGQTTQSYQWYDPELQLTVREELAGGYYRELRNIKVGVQPETLFTVPDDFRRIPAPGTNALPHELPDRSNSRTPSYR